MADFKRKCNICGSDSYRVLFPAGVAQIHEILQCEKCEFMFANTSAEAPEYETIESWNADDVERIIRENKTPRLSKEMLQVRDYASTRRFLAEIFPERGRLLEVGAGLGYLLDFFRKDGWDPIGVEPNRGMCQYAGKELNIKEIPAILPDAGIADASIDAALMMHVIEHVPDPTDTMREIYRVLRPGGMLVMETPRYDSLMFKILGRRERSLSCNGHIQFFTTKSLRDLAIKTGFIVVRESYVGRTMNIARLLYNVGVVSKSKRIQRKFECAAQRWKLDAISLSLNLRDMERIYLRKPA